MSSVINKSNAVASSLISQKKSLFWEEISAYAVVHTSYVVDTCNLFDR